MRPLWKADNDTLCNLYTFHCLLCIETFPPYSVYFLKLGLLRSGTKKIEFKTNCVSRGKNDDFFQIAKCVRIGRQSKTNKRANGEREKWRESAPRAEIHVARQFTRYSMHAQHICIFSRKYHFSTKSICAVHSFGLVP